VIDGPPEIVLHPVDRHEDLVQVPTPMLEMTHGLNAVPSDFSGENRPEPVPPEPHGLMRRVDAALAQQIRYIPQ
jgi:hypothetical protein